MRVHGDDAPFVDEQMIWFKCYPSSFLDGTDHMSAEDFGWYVRFIFRLYMRLGSIPADTRDGARVMRMDVRPFARVRDKLLAAGKLYLDGDMLRNRRTDVEIAAFFDAMKRRREAARTREDRKRQNIVRVADAIEREQRSMVELHSTSGGLPADFRPTSGGSLAEVPAIFAGSSANFSENCDEKVNEINVAYTTVVTQPSPQPDHRSAQSQNQSQKKKESTPLPPASGGRPAELVLEGEPAEPAAAQRRRQAKELIAVYNAAAEHHGWVPCKVVTPVIEQSILKRVRDIGGRDQFVIALNQIPNDDFLMGREPGRDGRKPFRLDLSKLLSVKSGMGDVLARLIDAAAAAPSGTRPKYWWEDPAKVASLSADDWRHLIAKHCVDGVWAVKKVGWPPGHAKCVIPSGIVSALRLTDLWTSDGFART